MLLLRSLPVLVVLVVLAVLVLALVLVLLVLLREHPRRLESHTTGR